MNHRTQVSCAPPPDHRSPRLGLSGGTVPGSAVSATGPATGVRRRCRAGRQRQRCPPGWGLAAVLLLFAAQQADAGLCDQKLGDGGDGGDGGAAAGTRQCEAVDARQGRHGGGPAGALPPPLPRTRAVTVAAAAGRAAKPAARPTTQAAAPTVTPNTLGRRSLLDARTVTAAGSRGRPSPSGALESAGTTSAKGGGAGKTAAWA